MDSFLKAILLVFRLQSSIYKFTQFIWLYYGFHFYSFCILTWLGKCEHRKPVPSFWVRLGSAGTPDLSALWTQCLSRSRVTAGLTAQGILRSVRGFPCSWAGSGDSKPERCRPGGWVKGMLPPLVLRLYSVSSVGARSTHKCQPCAWHPVGVPSPSCSHHSPTLSEGRLQGI